MWLDAFGSVHASTWSQVVRPVFPLQSSQVWMHLLRHRHQPGWVCVCVCLCVHLLGPYEGWKLTPAIVSSLAAAAGGHLVSAGTSTPHFSDRSSALLSERDGWIKVRLLCFDPYQTEDSSPDLYFSAQTLSVSWKVPMLPDHFPTLWSVSAQPLRSRWDV